MVQAGASDVQVRPEGPSDFAAVHALNLSAFPSPVEAELVDTLREQATPLVSLVAQVAGTIVGHILFSPVTLAGRPDLHLMGLGPMAVAATQRGRGIGSALVRAGLARCRSIGTVAVVVLGHPDYYPRFGFRPASEFGIGSEYDVPTEVFMALELVPDALSGAYGTVGYHQAFADL
jgi:putative acetyltransferase